MAADHAQWSWAKKFIKWNARPTGVNVGGSSYTTTKYLEKYEVDGFICAGKVLNPIFLSDYDAGIVEKWRTECKLVSQLRHTNIVQFLGIYYVPGVQNFPVILRELLPGNLHDFLEARSAITLSRKVSVLQDVARALIYLHSRSPSVMHCNLTARKVLLGADMTAKVSVGSCSKLVGPQKKSQLYMPPEAFKGNPQYDTRLDMFSFGHLALFTATQVYPEVLPPHYKLTYDGSVNEYIFARNEIERRQDSFTRLKDMGKKEVDEKLVQLIKECLHDEPAKRPTATQALKKLAEIKDKVSDNDPAGRMDQFELEQALRPNEASVQQTREIERLQRLYEVKKPRGFM